MDVMWIMQPSKKNYDKNHLHHEKIVTIVHTNRL